MIKNFEELKPQLTALAEIVNAFKSEAVQLRIIELVLASANTQPTPHASESIAGAGRTPSTTPRRTSRKKHGGDTNKTASPRQSSRGRLGAHAALSRMYDDGFFKGHKRTISDVVQHAGTNLAAKLKSSDLSGPLARYTRDKKLTRSKNTDKQYKYTEA